MRLFLRKIFLCDIFIDVLSMFILFSIDGNRMRVFDVIIWLIPQYFLLYNIVCVLIFTILKIPINKKLNSLFMLLIYISIFLEIFVYILVSLFIKSIYLINIQTHIVVFACVLLAVKLLICLLYNKSNDTLVFIDIEEERVLMSQEMTSNYGYKAIVLVFILSFLPYLQVFSFETNFQLHICFEILYLIECFYLFKKAINKLKRNDDEDFTKKINIRCTIWLALSVIECIYSLHIRFLHYSIWKITIYSLAVVLNLLYINILVVFYIKYNQSSASGE